jgi:dipeptidase
VRPNDAPHYAYSTRRVWRVLDLAAPSLKLPPYTNPMGDGLPFSVAPDAPVGVADVLGWVRDHYEGTPFDMTKVSSILKCYLYFRVRLLCCVYAT